jgi:hypothetical protein
LPANGRHDTEKDAGGDPRHHQFRPPVPLSSAYASSGRASTNPARKKANGRCVVPLLAYPIYGPDNPLPYKRNSYYRWDKAGLIKLIRVGGKTLISAADVEGILSGRIQIPQHTSRKRLLEPKTRTGGKRKAAR